jgi:hypothetical protein
MNKSLLLPFVCLSVSQNCSSIRFANKNCVLAILTTTDTFFYDTHSQTLFPSSYVLPSFLQKMYEQDNVRNISFVRDLQVQAAFIP